MTKMISLIVQLRKLNNLRNITIGELGLSGAAGINARKIKLGIKFNTST
tara:strand:- start:3575 stop:3721 length:147 start_codon:yes stop_codon:yes gene_type:complete